MARRVSLLFCLCLLLARPLAAAVIHVDEAANPGGDGASWATAVSSITAALQQAQAGDQIWVREGRYQEGLTIAAGVALYGGFQGDETDPSQRDPWRHPSRIVPPANTNQGEFLVTLDQATASRFDGFILSALQNRGALGINGGDATTHVGPLVVTGPGSCLRSPTPAPISLVSPWPAAVARASVSPTVTPWGRIR